MNKLISKGKYIKEYLSELSKLTSISVSESLLSDGRLLDKIKEAKIFRENGYSTQILFNNKEHLSRIIDELSLLNNGYGIYLLTEYSNHCGALFLNSICDFNSSFNFSDEHAGIISLISTDLNNEMIMDFWEEDGEQWLEIEIYGNKWPLVEDVIKLT